MKILVTGANGFLGINLVKQLVSSGHHVIALSRNKINFSHPVLKNILIDLNQLNHLTIDEDIDAVFHTAARINFDSSWESIATITNDNIMVSYYLAQFMIRHRIKNLILSSSCSVYQENYDKHIWTDENSVLRPQNLYAVSKLTGEWMLANELQGFVDNYIVLRYSSIYGPGQNPATILPIFIQKAGLQEPINIFGSGKRVQDYVYIDDVVKANMNCLNKKLPFYSIMNIGSGEPVSDAQLAAVIAETWNSRSEIKTLCQNIASETILNYNIKMANNHIGYKPLNIQQGLQLYYAAQNNKQL